MAKAPTLTDITNIENSAAIINANWDAIQAAFENTLSIDGSTPNQMEADFDMNSNDILNAKDVSVSGTLSVAGQDINDLINGLGEGTIYNSTNRFSGDGSTTIFTLTNNPISRANTYVYVNGIYQQKNTYTVSATTLTFSEAPPIGIDNIEVVIQQSVDSLASGTFLEALNNLSDLTNVTTARTNLGLGTASTSDAVDFATAAQGTLADSALQDGDSATLHTTTNTYTTRSAFVSDEANHTWVVGDVVIADGYMYEYDNTTTSISDLSGWKPFGQITPQHFGAVADGVTEDQEAIQASYEYAASVGKELFCPSGTYIVYLASKDSSSATFDVAPLHFSSDNTWVRGVPGQTIFKNKNTDGGHATVQFCEPPLSNGDIEITGGGVYGIVFDANTSDTTNLAGTSTAYMEGAKDFTIRLCTFKNTGGYALGMQNGGYVNVLVDQCIFENTGYDGVDLKNNPETVSGDSINFGVKFVGCLFRNCSRGENLTANASMLDIMGFGLVVEDCVFEPPAATDGSNYGSLIRIKQGLDGDTAGRGNGGQGAIIRGCSVWWDGSEQAPSTAIIDCRGPYSNVDGFKSYGTPPSSVYGVLFSQRYCTVSNCYLQGLERGIYLSSVIGDAASNPFTGADHTTIYGNVIDSCTHGVYHGRTGIKILNNFITNCTTGISALTFNATNQIIIGNTMVSNTANFDFTSGVGHTVIDNGYAAGLSTYSLDTAMQNMALCAPNTLRLGVGDRADFGEVLRVDSTTTAALTANRMVAYGSATGENVTIQAGGSDTNIGITIDPKGSGAVRIPGVPTYSSNSAAITDGRSAGDLYYRTGHGLDIVT